MLQLLLSSLSNPRETAPHILKWPLSQREVVLAAFLVAVLSGLLDAVARIILPLPLELQRTTISPVPLAIIQLASIFVISAFVFRVGGLFGGHGDYAGALKATIWVSVLGLFITAVTLLLMSVSPGLGALFQLMTLFWMLFVFTIFIQELHGFENFFTTLAGVLGTMFAVATVLVVVLSRLGLIPEGI